MAGLNAAFVPFTASTYWCVSDATPLSRCMMLSAVRSPASSTRALPLALTSTVSFAATCPSCAST